MLCTQYNRHFFVCPRAISTQIEPGTSTGTEAMACRTVPAVGPSESLQVSGRAAGGAVGFRRTPRPTKSAESQTDDAHCELNENCECPICFVGMPVLGSNSERSAGNLGEAAGRR